MSRRFAVVCLVVALCAVRVAMAQEPAAPKITSWSNSKTGDKKTVFQVKPGQKITFSVKAEGAEKYRWEVNGIVQEGVGGASFEWTVPDKSGIWKILVKTTNSTRNQLVDRRQAVEKRWIEKIPQGKGKDKFIQDMTDLGLYPLKGRKEWIVATFLAKVKPGESIQKAIDSLPPEGGIVELSPGLHNVRKTIVINRSNVIVYGTRDSEVRNDSGKEIFVFYHESPRPKENWKKAPVLRNFLFKGFKLTKGVSSRGGIGILAWNIRDITIEDILAESQSLIAVNPTGGGSSARSRNIVIKNNRVHNASLGCFHYSKNVYILDNIVQGTHAKVHTDRSCENVHIQGNHVDSTSRSYACIILDVGVYYEVRDNILIGERWGLRISAGVSHAIVQNNTIAKARKAGVYFEPQFGVRNITLRGNFIHHNFGDGIFARDIGYNMSGGSSVTVVNNICCNNGGDGIKMNSEWYEFLKVTNNIIANNRGYGINRLKGKLLHGYNDVWNNSKGNYNGTSAGKGDISVNPLFADPAKGDFHLKSKAGRWDPRAKKWVKDNVHSPCIDAGDPKTDFSMEPAPNGGRVNIGAYGNTKEASKSMVQQKRQKG